MSRLVIADVLQSCAHFIDVIIHQRTKTVLCFKVCGKNA